MAFATTAHLEARLGRTLTPTETTQAEALLDDATAFLRDIIGAWVAPQRASTVTVYIGPNDDWIGLPDPPVVSVDAVTVDGVAVTDWTLIDHALYRTRRWYIGNASANTDPLGRIPVEVTLTHGYETVPADLVAWCCVLASQAMTTVANIGALGSAGISGARIDDYSVSFNPQGAGFALPDRAVEQLRAAYGQGAHVTASR